MPGEIRIGTSGWNYPSGKGTWNGVFYPKRRPRGFDELRYYAERFDTVEVNSTFYRIPGPDVVRRWVERTPQDFLFSVKLYQKFTHPEMYAKRPGVTDWDLSSGDFDEFRLGLDPLASAGRLAAILVQFPESFHAGEAARGYLDWLLAAFAEYPLSVELRHHSWDEQGARTRAQLAEHGASWAVIDQPGAQSARVRSARVRGAKDARPQVVPPDDALSHFAPAHPAPAHSAPAHPAPAHPAPSRAAPVYLRLHGRNAAAWWQHAAAEDRYNYLYSRAELAPFAERAKQASRTGRRVLMYLNNHFSAKAVANAAVLKHELDQPLQGDYPGEMVSRYPELSGVVSTSGLPW